MMKYIIFDLDGTLIDSMGIWENIAIEFLQIHNKKANTSLSAKLATLSIRQAAQLLKKEYDLTQSGEDIIAEIAELVEEKYKNEVQLKPFVLETLNNFKEQKVRMCIATASAAKSVNAVLTRFNLGAYFDFILTADDVETSKDDAEIFNLCAKKFGAPISEIVVIEDAFHAIQTAKKAGFKVIGVYDSSSADDKQKIKAICDIYIENMLELRGVF